MHGRRRALLAALWALGLGATGLLLPGPAQGQGFTLPEGALTPITQIQLSYQSLDSESRTKEPGSPLKEQTSSRQDGARGFVGIAIDPVIFGGSGHEDKFSTRTTSFRLDEVRRGGQGFVTLGVGHIALVVSASEFVEDSEVEDRSSGFRVKRRLELNTDFQYAIFIRLPFFRFGYAQDQRRMKLEFQTAAGGTLLSSIVERYSFPARTLDFLLILRGERGPFFTFRRAESEADEAKGELFDFAGATEDIEALSLGWKFGPGEAITLAFSRTQLTFGFTGITELESEKISRTLAVDLPDGLSLQVTQTQEETRNEFFNVSGLEVIETIRSRIEVGLGWRF